MFRYDVVRQRLPALGDSAPALEAALKQLEDLQTSVYHRWFGVLQASDGGRMRT
jgi:hypothetical protein